MGYLGYKPADKPLTAADITDSIITSAKIVDGTIVNADINASAGLVLTKLASTGTLTVDNIQFPATAVASANANNLDDYEEGTFTPNVGGTATYSYQDGKYTKIGNVVYVSIGMAITTIGTGSVNVISGLPFTCRGTLSAPTLAVNYFDNLNTSLTFLAGAVNQGATTVAFRSTAGVSINMTIAPSIFKTPSTILLSGCYDI
jgi:hypothetical protein